MLALVVVLPTPPLPEVTTMISAKLASSVMLWERCSVERRKLELSVFQPDLHGLAAQFRGDVFQHLVVPGDRDEFGMELAAEDPGASRCRCAPARARPRRAP